MENINKLSINAIRKYSVVEGDLKITAKTACVEGEGEVSTK